MSSIYRPTPKFKVGDSVIADDDVATVTEILPPADSEWDKQVSYEVRWPSDEWGTFEEDELSPA